MEYIPFPFDRDDEVPIPDDDPVNHPCLRQLEKEVDTTHMCGYISMLRTGATSSHPPSSQSAPLFPPSIPLSPPPGAPPPAGRRRREAAGKRAASQATPQEAKQKTEISEFLDDLRELGIGDPKSPTVKDPDSMPREQPSKESHSDSSMSPVQKRLAQEWVPLAMSFGVPLFNEQANRAVCDKVRGGEGREGEGRGGEGREGERRGGEGR